MSNTLNSYELSILVNGRKVDKYHHTDGKTYIEGRKKSRFEIEFINNTDEQVLTIFSVDGLSVMDGAECGLDSSGYVVDAKSSIKIPGWRLNSGKVAQFIFQSLKNSYASKSSSGVVNAGAIGAMVFKPMVRHHWNVYNPYPWGQILTGSDTIGSFTATTSDTLILNNTTDIATDSMSSSINLTTESSDAVNMTSSTSTIGAALNTSTGSSTTVNHVSRGIDAHGQNAITDSVGLGTGFGREKSFNTSKTEFEKRDPKNPDAMLAIFYDTSKGLERKGINIRTRRSGYVEPNPFPGVDSDGCTPPDGWRRR